MRDVGGDGTGGEIDLPALMVAGHPGDAPALAGGEQMSVLFNCTAIENVSRHDDADLYETELDLSHGNSGGPLWGWLDTGDQRYDARVLAVVSVEADFASWGGVVH